jgi:8-oxo-dGTP pyrophosphatase MutT (NUDIX family)
MHKKVMPGKWCVPGGGLSTDDYTLLPPSTKTSNQWYGSLDKALRREVKEEVNVELGPIEYLTDLTFIRPDGVPVLCVSYFGQYLSGDVKLDEDATEYAWISVDEVSRYDLIEGVDHEIQMVDEILKKRKTG